MSQDWDIKPRGELCHKCQASFVEDQPYHSSLVFGEDGYARADFCQTCWEHELASLAPYSAWQGVFKRPEVQEDVLKKETAESLLRRLMEDEDGFRRNAIYILAVMLERKRILVEKDVQKRDNGDLVRVYEHRKTGETFVVPDPGLQLDQLEHVQQEVVTMLGGGEQPPAAEATAPASPAGQNPAGPHQPPSSSRAV
jgi:hypothetical protein